MQKKSLSAAERARQARRSWVSRNVDVISQ